MSPKTLFEIVSMGTFVKVSFSYTTKSQKNSAYGAYLNTIIIIIKTQPKHEAASGAPVVYFIAIIKSRYNNSMGKR